MRGKKKEIEIAPNTNYTLFIVLKESVFLSNVWCMKDRITSAGVSIDIRFAFFQCRGRYVNDLYLRLIHLLIQQLHDLTPICI